MKRYEVIIKERILRSVIVEADSIEEAEEKGQDGDGKHMGRS